MPRWGAAFWSITKAEADGAHQLPPAGTASEVIPGLPQCQASRMTWRGMPPMLLHVLGVPSSSCLAVPWSWRQLAASVSNDLAPHASGAVARPGCPPAPSALQRPSSWRQLRAGISHHMALHPSNAAACPGWFPSSFCLAAALSLRQHGCVAMTAGLPPSLTLGAVSAAMCSRCLLLHCSPNQHQPPKSNCDMGMC